MRFDEFHYNLSEIKQSPLAKRANGVRVDIVVSDESEVKVLTGLDIYASQGISNNLALFVVLANEDAQEIRRRKPWPKRQ